MRKKTNMVRVSGEQYYTRVIKALAKAEDGANNAQEEKRQQRKKYKKEQRTMIRREEVSKDGE